MELPLDVVAGPRAPRVVLVGQHAMVREAIVSHLGQHLGDLEVVHAGGCAVTAVTVVGQDGADVTILDLDAVRDCDRPALEAVTGLVATAIPLLIVGDTADPPLVHACINAGALGFVSKRDSLAELVLAMRAVLRGESYASPGVKSALVDENSLGTVGLSDRERTAALLYATGLTMAQVGEQMSISTFTVQEYIKRVRRKFDEAGRPSHTKTALYREFRREGLLA